MKFPLFLLTLCLLLNSTRAWSGTPPEIAPDVYDTVFNDDSATSTLNFIESGVPQSHVLRSALDQDWLIFPTPQDDAFFYTIALVVPEGASMINPSVIIQR